MNDTLNDTLNDANDTLNKPLKPGITSDYGNHKEQIILLVREDPAITQEQLAQALKVAEELTGRDEREPRGWRKRSIPGSVQFGRNTIPVDAENSGEKQNKFFGTCFMSEKTDITFCKIGL